MTKITESLLPKYGYEKTYEFTGKDFVGQTFDTQKFVEFTKKVNDYFGIAIEFSYEAEIEDKFKLYNVTANLRYAGDTIIPLDLNIKKLENLHKAMLLAHKQQNNGK